MTVPGAFINVVKTHLFYTSMEGQMKILPVALARSPPGQQRSFPVADGDECQSC